MAIHYSGLGFPVKLHYRNESNNIVDGIAFAFQTDDSTPREVTGWVVAIDKGHAGQTRVIEAGRVQRLEGLG
jgi:hypothetical protein